MASSAWSPRHETGHTRGFTLKDVKNLLGHSSIVLTANTNDHGLEQRLVAMGMDAVLGG